MERKRPCTQPRLGRLSAWVWESCIHGEKQTFWRPPDQSRVEIPSRGKEPHIKTVSPTLSSAVYIVSRILFLPSTYKYITRTHYLPIENNGRHRKIWRNLNRYASARGHRRWCPTSSFPQSSRLGQK